MQPQGSMVSGTVAVVTWHAHRNVVVEMEANHRAALVRVVVAQQWAVAVAVVNGSGVWIALGCDEKRWTGFGDDDVCAFNVAALPCPDDVVADLLGEVRS
jgi:hypothetical protein